MHYMDTAQYKHYALNKCTVGMILYSDKYFRCLFELP